MLPSDLNLPAKFSRYFPGQEETLLSLIASPRRFKLLCAPTGCLAGGTLIQIARGSGIKVSNRVCIANEFMRQQGAYGRRRNPNVISHTRSLIDGSLRLQPISGVAYSGIRKTFTLSLRNGNSLRATADHRILTTNGWVELCALSSSDKVVIDIGIQGKERRKPKPIYKQVQGLRFHPYANHAESRTIKPRCLKPEGRLYRVAYHRLVIEASINGVSVEDLISICRNSESIAQQLSFLDPSEFAVHHIDGNVKNNERGNLEVLSHADHARVHDPAQHLANLTGEVEVDRVNSYREEHTFDLICSESHPNFVANGIIVHNSGKSLINASLASLTPGRSLFLATTKALQEQYANDGYPQLYSISGHGNYPCASRTYTAEGEIEGMECGAKDCRYRAAVTAACRSPWVVTNYAHNVYAMLAGDPERLGEFGLLICDEAHNIDKLLTDYLSVHLARDTIRRHLGIDLPADIALPSVISWARHAHHLALDIQSGMSRQGSYADPRDKSRIQKLERDLGRLAAIDSTDKDWVLYREPRGLGVSPKWVNRHAETYLFRNVPSVVLCSATLTRETAKRLGISPDDYDYFEAPSRFASARRPLIYIPTVRVDRRAGDGEYRQLVSRADNIAMERLQWKGIIHAQSYDLRDKFIRLTRLRDILLTHDRHNTKEVIRNFIAARGPCILISPSVREGYDFPLDACRWQIILKVPYPPSVDPVFAARVADDKSYRYESIGISIMQMVGRGMRLPDDWCESFIIDDHFSYLGKYVTFPGYFKAATRRVSDIPPPLGLTFERKADNTG